MLPLGQEDFMQSFALTYRSLPAVLFEDVASEDVRDLIRPLTVRRLVQNGETFYYVVNDSPWNVGVDLYFRSTDRSLTMRSLGVNRPDRLLPNSNGYEWNINVKPYELIAVAMSSEDVMLAHGQSALPPDVSRSLEKRIAALMSRARYLSKPVEYTTLPNSGFEATSRSQTIPSWIDSATERSSVRLSAGYKSAQSMRVTSADRPSEIRSAPFAAPKSNRIAVEFLARSASHSPLERESAAARKSDQPRLRIGVEQGGSELFTWQVNDFRMDAMGHGWQKIILPLRNLPAPPSPRSSDGVQDLTLRFDVLPNTDLQIDDVRLFDTLLLSADELRALSEKKISLPAYMWRHRFYGDCNRFLNSYWPQYLMKNVPEAAEVPPAMTRRPPPKRKPVRTSDNWKKWFTPRLPGLR